MKRVNKKRNQLGLLRAKSNAWKPLRDFKQEWHVIFDFGTWDMTLFFSQHCFQMCLSDPLSSTFDDISRRSCRLPVRFSSTDSLALTMDAFTDIKKSSTVYIQTAISQSIHSFSSFCSVLSWGVEPAVCSIISVSAPPGEDLKEGGDSRKRGKCPFAGSFSDLEDSVSSLYHVLPWHGWCFPEISSCDTSPAPVSKSVSSNAFLLAGQDTLKMARVQLPSVTWPSHENVCILAGNSGWSTGSSLPPAELSSDYSRRKADICLYLHTCWQTPEDASQVFPRTLCSKLMSLSEHQAGKWVSSVLPWRHLQSLWTILMSHFPWFKGQWSLFSLWEREEKSQNKVFLHPRPQWPPLPW